MRLLDLNSYVSYGVFLEPGPGESLDFREGIGGLYSKTLALVIMSKGKPMIHPSRN